MELSKTQKVLLGIFTFSPFFIFPFIFWQLFDAIINIIKISELGEPEPREIMVEVFAFIFPIGMLAFCSLALLIFYIVHAVINKKIQPPEQLLWVLLFIFLGIIAFPVYWVIRIWNNSNNP
jgi:hypothetical protein